VIVGPTPLHGAEIEIPDLRAGFSYVIAALAAQGESTLLNTGIIERGYENLIGKLIALGAGVVSAS
jgi:UDP-N-acetylglucosamine 1-carboxyvinyltransferase